MESVELHELAVPNSEQLNTSKWETLGSVRPYGYDSYYELYVRIMGGRFFYKLKRNSSEYAVSLGKYTYQGCSFNAKACDNMYFNI